MEQLGSTLGQPPNRTKNKKVISIHKKKKLLLLVYINFFISIHFVLFYFFDIIQAKITM